MAKYLARKCSPCAGYLGIVLREPDRNTPAQAVNGHCLECDYRLAWIVIRVVGAAFREVTTAALRHPMEPVSLAARRTLQILGVALILALFVGLGFGNGQEFVRVKRVIDGDTIMLESGERVRLIGVDTPETVHPNKPVERFGKAASAFTRRMAEGKSVRLEYDSANAARGHKDNTQQRRTLAYVFLEDGTLLNAEIIRQGYGHAYTRFPFSRMEEFRRFEREAREKRRGFWAEEP